MLLMVMVIFSDCGDDNNYEGDDVDYDVFPLLLTMLLMNAHHHCRD